VLFVISVHWPLVINILKILFLLQEEVGHGVSTVFVKLGNTKIEVSMLVTNLTYGMSCLQQSLKRVLMALYAFASALPPMHNIALLFHLLLVLAI